MTSATPSWALPGEPFGVAYRDAYRTVSQPVQAWPQTWPEGLRAAGQIWRADVFDVAQAWRREEVPTRSLLTAALAWGYGRVGYGPHRASLTLAAPDLDERLAHLDPLRTEAPGTEALLAA